MEEIPFDNSEAFRTLTPEQRKALTLQAMEIDKAIVAARRSKDDHWKEWLVDLPEYNRDGVDIKRFSITEEAAYVDALRAALNPQRSDRSVQAGIFTSLTVDNVLWMTDTPAEVVDLLPVDDAMAWDCGSRVLIVGLGLGLIVRRAILAHGMVHIDVVEQERRIIDAVGPHYQEMAAENGVTLNIHHSDIHEWKIPKDSWWNVGWFDIWAHIDADDLPEVTRLRKRFHKRLDWFGAWAQPERIAQKRRIASGRWAY